MSFDPSLTEQALLEDTFRRRAQPMRRQEALPAMISAVALASCTAVVWSIAPPHAFALAPALICLLVLTVSSTIPFDTPLGFTVPTQLAFVPLLFAMPLALVPIAVTVAFLLAKLPDVVRGGVRPSRLLIQATNAWFSIGPVAVFAIAHVDPRHAGAALLLAALGGQFLADWTVSSVMFARMREASLSSMFGSTWVYGIDAALSGVGLVVAEEIHASPLAPLALVPLLGLLAVFAHERRRRLESMLELSSAYRGTALVLGDVIEADDGYTGEHCQSVVSLALELADRLGLTPSASATWSSPPCCTTSARSRSPRRSSTSPASSTPTSGPSSRPTPSKARRCSNASAGSCARSATSSAPTTSAGTAPAIPTVSSAKRSRSRPASSPAATPGTRCAPTAPTAGRWPTRSPSRS